MTRVELKKMARAVKRHRHFKDIGLDWVDSLQRTPFHYAAETGSFRGLKYLISQVDSESKLGTYFSKKDKRGLTPFLLALTGEHLANIDIFMKNKADLTTPLPGGKYPIHLATRSENTDILDCLLHRIHTDTPDLMKTVLTQQDSNGDIALNYAVHANNDTAIDYLLSFDPDLDTLTHQGHRKKSSPIHQAARHKGGAHALSQIFRSIQKHRPDRLSEFVNLKCEGAEQPPIYYSQRLGLIEHEKILKNYSSI